MRYCYWHKAVASLLAMGGAITSYEDCALAQIAPDGTLGAESSVVTPTNINGIASDRIDGGAIRGANLFHSFEKFSVFTGSSVYFNNTLEIQNIISRVTGSSISNIDGLLRANGTANLFLLNPNGIIFGPSASLNIGGSFLGSTASAVNFIDGTQFSATAHPTTPLLTVSVPLGLQFGVTARSIQYQSRASNIDSGESGGLLRVQPGKTLALVGGDVSLNGGNLIAEGGRVELGGLAGPGTVGLQVDGNNLSLSYPEQVQRADVSLSNGVFVSANAGGEGSIAINARNLDVLGGSRLFGGIASGLGSPEATAGDITLNATEAITVGQSSRIENNVNRNATGNAGNISITAGSLSLTNVASLVASTFGQGDAGSVNINARDTVSFDGVSAAFSTVQERAVGNAGGINITTGLIEVKNGAALAASTLGQGNAGSVNINAHDTVSFDGADSNGLQSAAFSTVDEGAVGNGGDINITTGSLAVTNGAALTASTLGQGNAGSVNINARNAVSFDAGDAFSSVRSGAVGNGGSINVKTGSLSVSNGAQLVAITRGQGNAGSVNINARDTVSFDGVSSDGLFSSGTFSSVLSGAVGNGGNINIRTGALAVTDGAELESSTFGQGNAGSVTITARDIVSFDGGYALSTVEEEAVGNGTDINITTGSLSVSNGAQLQALTRGQGNAGSVNINARNAVSFNAVGSNGFASAALSTVEPGAVGSGGGINITASSLSLTDGAKLSTSSEGNGAAGNIKVAASSISLDNQAVLSADTAAGQGDIFLDSQDLVLRRGSNITTNTTGTAPGGNITIDTGIIAALENSDISANADQAFGGQVRITAQGIFGIEFRQEQTSASDITATGGSPELSGTVEINTPDVDPSLGLVALPAQLVDASGLIASGCGSGGRQGSSKFIVTGRGGLPYRPIDANISPYPTGTVRSIPSSGPSSDSATSLVSGSDRSTNRTTTAPTQIVEVQGWVINNKGLVVLTATAPTVTSHSPWIPEATCHGVKKDPLGPQFTVYASHRTRNKAHQDC